MKAWKHFKTITHHRFLVMEGCFKVGLYKQGLLHDLSKYSPSEFLAGVKYYQGNRSPNNAQREDIGYSSAMAAVMALILAVFAVIYALVGGFGKEGDL